MKTPLVLLSGLLSNDSLWYHQKRHLDDIASIHIISSFQDTPEKMVGAILDQAPSQFALAGHSMGGWLCLEVMRQAPHRVSKLCLLNTTGRMDSKEKNTNRQTMIQRAEKGQFPDVVKEIVGKFVFNPHVKKDVETMFLKVGAQAFINQEKAMLARRESQTILPSITCPTLVVHADQDKVFSLEEHRELVNQICGAKLATVNDSGHMSPMEIPESITALLREWIT